MDLLAVLAQPQKVGCQGTLGLVGVSRLGLLSLLLLWCCGRATANSDEFAGLNECAEVHLARVEVDIAAEDSVGVVNVCAGGILEGVLERDP